MKINLYLLAFPAQSCVFEWVPTRRPSGRKTVDLNADQTGDVQSRPATSMLIIVDIGKYLVVIGMVAKLKLLPVVLKIIVQDDSVSQMHPRNIAHWATVDINYVQSFRSEQILLQRVNIYVGIIGLIVDKYTLTASTQIVDHGCDWNGNEGKTFRLSDVDRILTRHVDLIVDEERYPRIRRWYQCFNPG
jgi:hypothetical protein